jgi:hypothetical protein
MKTRWPNMRALTIACAVTWLSAVVGVVVGLTTRNWGMAIYAINAALCAAGWLIAAIRWAQYQLAAAQMAAVLEAMRADGQRWLDGDE